MKAILRKLQRKFAEFYVYFQLYHMLQLVKHVKKEGRFLVVLFCVDRPSYDRQWIENVEYTQTESLECSRTERGMGNALELKGGWGMLSNWKGDGEIESLEHSSKEDCADLSLILL
jgi:hypothetical protein